VRHDEVRQSREGETVLFAEKEIQSVNEIAAEALGSPEPLGVLGAEKAFQAFLRLGRDVGELDAVAERRMAADDNSGSRNFLIAEPEGEFHFTRYLLGKGQFHIAAAQTDLGDLGAHGNAIDGRTKFYRQCDLIARMLPNLLLHR